jgi:hypothetical protein
VIEKKLELTTGIFKNGADMKVFKADDFDVCAIEFCCKHMAEDILFGRVKTTPWTDHPLYFSAGNYRLSHCGHCGAKIAGEEFRYQTQEQQFEAQTRLSAKVDKLTEFIRNGVEYGYITIPDAPDPARDTIEEICGRIKD